MPVNKYEPIHDANMIGGWQVDFTESIRKLQEQKKYDEVWELIKKKNHWS
jgi:hypothetical protein